jgi:RHS repeat-associated protein
VAAASGEPPPPGVDANSTSGRDEPGSSTFTPSQTFAYDAAGNRLEVTDNGMTTKYQPNAANQYEQIVTGTEIVEPQFDPLGNLLQDDRNTYTWDSDIHLLSVSTMSKERPGTKNQEQRTDFRYDPLHRRVARLEKQSELALFTHDGWNVIQEHSGNVKLKTSNLERSARHTWGEDLSGTLQGAGGVGGLLSTIHNVAKTKTQEQEIASWFHYDSNGNVILLTDVAGDASARYAYDAFGQTLTGTGIAADLNCYRFSTKPIESGSGLAYYGYRYYDPVSGRWPSRDPIGELGGLNIYAMTGNSMIGGIDKLGFSPRCPSSTCGGYSFSLSRGEGCCNDTDVYVASEGQCCNGTGVGNYTPYYVILGYGSPEACANEGIQEVLAAGFDDGDDSNNDAWTGGFVRGGFSTIAGGVATIAGAHPVIRGTASATFAGGGLASYFALRESCLRESCY